MGGFASRAEAQKALRKALDRVGPGRGGAITLAELVEEYLELHQAEPVTVAKLRWLLGKATGVLGEKRIADLSPKDVYAWRLTIPEGTSLRSDAGAPASSQPCSGVGGARLQPGEARCSEPQRRPKEKRPFESWAQIEAIVAQLGPVLRTDGDLRRRDRASTSELFGLEQHDVDREAASSTCGVRSRMAGSSTPRPG